VIAGQAVFMPKCSTDGELLGAWKLPPASGSRGSKVRIGGESPGNRLSPAISGLTSRQLEDPKPDTQLLSTIAQQRIRIFQELSDAFAGTHTLDD
jgi:hypothetical protein